MNKVITVSIVLYDTDPLEVARCLESLFQCQVNLQILLIDNSETSALSKLEIIQSDSRIKYIHVGKNLGYGAAHNISIRKAVDLGSEYHLVLNADVHFDRDIISPIIKFMDEHKNVAQVMPKILSPDGSVQYLCKFVPSPLDLVIHRFFPGERTEFFEMRFSGYSRKMFVPYLSGCFMFLRVEALKAVGFFDERFFMYPEDIDLTRRLAERYETIFFPEVSIVHKFGGASRKSIKMFLIHSVNIVRYFNKWGWFVDRKRDYLNKKALDQFGSR
jgi:GT2 family glycosyltransferase